jgi:DNA mismatch repair protein MutS
VIYEWYVQKKQEMPACILLLRIGDFYEAFDEDARTLAEVCGVMVFPRQTSTGAVDMAGIPVGVLVQYLLRLRRAGYDVRTLNLEDKYAEDDCGRIREDAISSH